MLDTLLDPLTGAIVARRTGAPRAGALRGRLGEARERLGDAATAHDLARTPKQRRADALRSMAERSAAKPADATEARVLLQVLIGHESVERLCELSNGTVLTPGQVLPVLDRADVERVIFDGPSKVIDVGVRRRLFTGGTRTAVHAHDRGCTHPSCDEPLDRCQIDHIVPWSRAARPRSATPRTTAASTTSKRAIDHPRRRPDRPTGARRLDRQPVPKTAAANWWKPSTSNATSRPSGTRADLQGRAEEVTASGEEVGGPGDVTPTALGQVCPDGCLVATVGRTPRAPRQSAEDRVLRDIEAALEQGGSHAARLEALLPPVPSGSTAASDTIAGSTSPGSGPRRTL